MKDARRVSTYINIEVNKYKIYFNYSLPYVEPYAKGTRYNVNFVSSC